MSANTLLSKEKEKLFNIVFKALYPQIQAYLQHHFSR